MKEGSGKSAPQAKKFWIILPFCDPLVKVENTDTSDFGVTLYHSTPLAQRS